MTRPRFNNKIVLFLVASAAIACWPPICFGRSQPEVKALLEQRMGGDSVAFADTIVNVVKLVLLGSSATCLSAPELALLRTRVLDSSA